MAEVNSDKDESGASRCVQLLSNWEETQQFKEKKNNQPTAFYHCLLSSPLYSTELRLQISQHPAGLHCRQNLGLAGTAVVWCPGRPVPQESCQGALPHPAPLSSCSHSSAGWPRRSPCHWRSSDSHTSPSTLQQRRCDAEACLSFHLQPVSMTFSIGRNL